MKKNKKLYILSAAFIALTATSLSAAAETPEKTKITLSTGYNYSSGDYGQAIDTNVTYIPVMAKVKYDNWTAKLTVPYISITGPGNVVGEDTQVVGAAGIKRTESGLGDVTASLGYTIPFGHGTFGDVTGKIKFPTADDVRKLGTGNTDYTLQAGLTKTIGEAFLTGNVGRKFNGSSATSTLNDVWKYSLGAGYNFTPELSAGASYDFREGATATSKNFSQVTEFASYKLTEDWAAQIYLAQGLTDATANTAYGAQLSYKFTAFGN